MPITVHEKAESRRHTQDSVTLIFQVRGTEDDVAALTALFDDMSTPDYAPDTFGGFPRSGHTMDWLGPNLWEAQVVYSIRQASQSAATPTESESVFAFDTLGGTERITHSLMTMGMSEDAPDFEGAINVTDDGVEGVDIEAPGFSFSETHYFEDAEVTPTFKANLKALSKKVNNAAFKGHAAGEVFFRGATGTRRGDGPWEITFHFVVSENVTDIEIPNVVTGLEKDGWDLLWIRYEDAEDGAAERLVKRGAAAYVERVYRRGDFSLLGIGT